MDRLLRQVRNHETVAKHGDLALTIEMSTFGSQASSCPPCEFSRQKRLFKLQSAELVHQKRAKPFKLEKTSRLSGVSSF